MNGFHSGFFYHVNLVKKLLFIVNRFLFTVQGNRKSDSLVNAFNSELEKKTLLLIQNVYETLQTGSTKVQSVIIQTIQRHYRQHSINDNVRPPTMMIPWPTGKRKPPLVMIPRLSNRKT
jgi:hypothetical protein